MNLRAVEDEIKRLQLDLRMEGIKLYVAWSPPFLVLHELVIPKGIRGEGRGAEIMEHLARLADENGVPMALTPSVDFGGTSVARLERFYRRFGFLPNRGRTRDFTTREGMIRLPRASGPSRGTRRNPPKLYFRFQPKGTPLLGHTSEGSTSSLPPGFVFAYEWDNPREAVEWFDATLDDEVVVFTGGRAFDPGDAEGVAVRPVREVRRMSVREWARHARLIRELGWRLR